MLVSARVYMEGFSQGAMIAHNIVVLKSPRNQYCRLSMPSCPDASTSAKQRDFAVNYVEGDGDGVPDIA